MRCVVGLGAVLWLDCPLGLTRHCSGRHCSCSEELSDDKVWVAIAPDALAADKDIAPDDFQVDSLGGGMRLRHPRLGCGGMRLGQPLASTWAVG